jgi:hypothetical protein
MKTVQSLQRLAAKAAARACRGGRWVADYALTQLPFPEPLIRLVLPHVILSHWEFEDFVREEEFIYGYRWIDDNPRMDDERYEKIKQFYKTLYGEKRPYRDFCSVII